MADLRIGTFTLGRPYHAALVTLAGRRETAMHGHTDFAELMYVLSGSGAQLLDRGRQELRAGDLILVRDTDRHCLTGHPAPALRFINIAFPTAPWLEFLALADAGWTASWADAPLPPRAPLAGRQRASARAEFRRALDRFLDRPTALDLIRLWTEVLPHLGGESGESGAGDHGPDDARTPRWLREACAAMHDEDNLRAGLPRLLDIAAVSHGHLARNMRTHHGTTPIRFITDLRLRLAARLLATTSDTVTGIAARSGFASQSYFTRCFRRAHGMSPREFRVRAYRSVVP